MRFVFSIQALLIASLTLVGCATTRFDRIPARQSSYRIRGTDEVGVLSAGQARKLQSKTRSWRWPTNEVVITSAFGSRGHDHHDGIDLRAHSGTPVQAAADGKVIYAGAKISGYGRMIVIRHSGKLSTIYAHNSKLYVRMGESVRRGQRIALSGNTGHSSGPHLHFEVREGVTAINPLMLMPSPAIANEANRRIARKSSTVAEHAYRGTRASRSAAPERR